MNIIKTLFIIFALASNLLASNLYAQGTNVPEPLKDWVDWVLHDKEGLECPYSYNSPERLCV